LSSIVSSRGASTPTSSGSRNFCWISRATSSASKTCRASSYSEASWGLVFHKSSCSSLSFCTASWPDLRSWHAMVLMRQPSHLKGQAVERQSMFMSYIRKLRTARGGKDERRLETRHDNSPFFLLCTGSTGRDTRGAARGDSTVLVFEVGLLMSLCDRRSLGWLVLRLF